MWMLIFYQPTATTVNVRVFYPGDSNLVISLLLCLMLVDVVSIEGRTLYGCILTTFCHSLITHYNDMVIPSPPTS